MVKNNYVQFVIDIIVLLVFTLITLLYFWPVVTHFTTFLPGDYDELFITWSITRMAQQLPLNLHDLFQSPIFYPHPYTHAYSDTFITSGLLAKPFMYFFQEPIAAFNANLLISQVLTLFFCYQFIHKLIKDRLLAIGFSLINGFSPILLHYLPHLHTFSQPWLPLSGWSLLKLKESNQVRYLYLWGCCLVLQFWNSPLGGYFILVLSLVLGLGYGSLRNWLKRHWLHSSLVLGLIGALIYPVFSAYQAVSQYFQYTRPLTEVIHFSLSPEELWTKFQSPIVYGLFGVSLLVSAFSSKISSKNAQQRGLIFLGAALTVIILALGPALHWFRQTVKIPFHIPLPYLVLYYLVPGFQGFRTPSRWLVLGAFLAVLGSSHILSPILKKDVKLKFFFLILVGILLIKLTPVYTTYVRVPTRAEYPPVYQWLKDQPDGPVLELPITAWGDTPQHRQEVYRMLYSLDHQKPLVNGYSGFFPPEYLDLVNQIKTGFLTDPVLKTLQRYQVKYLIIHRDQYGQDQAIIDERLRRLMETGTLKPVTSFGSDQVYGL